MVFLFKLQFNDPIDTGSYQIALEIDDTMMLKND